MKFLLSLGWAAIMMTGAQAAECSMGRAVYVPIRNAPDRLQYRIEFDEAANSDHSPTKLAARIFTPKAKTPALVPVDTSNGYVTDNIGSYRIYVLNPGMAVETLPAAHDAAAPYLFLPSLGITLYQADQLLLGETIWKFARCR